MNLLVAYDRARAAIAEAKTVKATLQIRDWIDHLKLHAKKVQDRELLAEAADLQLHCERQLGEMLEAAEKAGDLRAPGARGKAAGADVDDARPATLKEIGVDKKLSATSRRAAALGEAEFKEIVATTRDKIRSGGAILIDPIKAAAKTAEQNDRRAAHAARTIGGGSIEDLGKMAREGRKFGSIGSDPQWKFLTRSAAGEGRSANIHYKTEEVDKIKNLPVGELLADDGAFYMWMVDWCPQDALDLLAHYGLQHITTAFTWVKTNGDGRIGAPLDPFAASTWHMGQGYWTRANPEVCWFATKADSKKKPKRLYADVRQLIVAPVMEHSRKPDAWLDRIERLTPGDYLELQARRTRPGWVSWGDELEFTGVAA
ncbi:MT-A70 family methyltransferase [Bradyrhizobium sp. JYMT SZCCT0428]|uniref:MT-A70 family methyltransferase n=1 Tax=Bradyrhizobium sp. JYMT SZCCT0428 TaxID=2807673 RepID=UPI00201100D7|nr:MT-A70 family methyltransferase [Bradyrhizobium sp. JYMT SZCCT0428]